MFYKSIVCFLLITLTSFCKKKDSQSVPIVNSSKVFYIAPSGSDSHPGTIEKPWKSFAKATERLRAGDTAIFENGEYFEKSILIFNNSGREGSPIVFMSKNKHKAKIIFPASTKDVQKINLTGQQFIVIKDFEITQVERSLSKTTDIFIRADNSNYCSFVGNKIYYCFEEGIKVYGNSTNILIQDNEIFDMQHEGIDVLNVEDVIIEGNKVYEVGRVGIMVKGGARNVKVYNNIVRNLEKRMSTSGITIGGVSNKNAPYDVSSTGFEAYNVFVWNNLVLAQNSGEMRAGISFMGAKDSHVYNNVIIGPTYAIEFRSPNGITNGWDWDPIVINPVIKNNIMMNIEKDALWYNDHFPENLYSDYNLYHNIGGVVPTEENSIYADPLFVDVNNDFKLKSGSPAVGSGFKLSDTFPGFNNTKLKFDFKNFDGKTRGTNWNIGVY